MAKKEIALRLSLTITFRLMFTVAAIFFIYTATSYEMAGQDLYPPARHIFTAIINMTLGLTFAVIAWAVPANTIIRMFRRA